MIRTGHAVDLLRNVVRKQLVNAAEEIRIVLAASGEALEAQRAIAPQELVAPGFLHEADHPPARAGCDFNSQRIGFEPDERLAVEVEFFTHGIHGTFLPEPNINAHQDRAQHAPPQPETLVPLARFSGFEHGMIPKVG